MTRIISPGLTDPSRERDSARVRASSCGMKPLLMSQGRQSLASAASGTACLIAAAFLAGQASPAMAGPVICTTSLEAPIVGIREASGAVSVPLSPVEVTRCGIVQTPAELMERRAYGWTSPFARGVDLTHQVTDLFGIAMGGGDGTKVMGFGFGDQTLIWDGTAIENTTQVLLDDQANPMPLRTADLLGVYGSSLGSGAPAPAPAPEASSGNSGAYRSFSSNLPVRGM